MAIALTCPLLVWLSITQHQSSCARKYEIMSLESNQSDVYQGLKVSTSCLVSEEVLQICFNKMFILKEVCLSTCLLYPHYLILYRGWMGKQIEYVTRSRIYTHVASRNVQGLLHSATKKGINNLCYQNSKYIFIVSPLLLIIIIIL